MGEVLGAVFQVFGWLVGLAFANLGLTAIVLALGFVYFRFGRSGSSGVAKAPATSRTYQRLDQAFAAIGREPRAAGAKAALDDEELPLRVAVTVARNQYASVRGPFQVSRRGPDWRITSDVDAGFMAAVFAAPEPTSAEEDRVGPTPVDPLVR